MTTISSNRVERPRFKRRKEDNFQDAVKERVAQWFEANGLSTHANRQMKLKSALHIICYFLAWALILSNQFQGFTLIFLFSIFGLIQGLMGFNISHDAVHGAYSASSKINRRLGYLFDWNGESSLIWRVTHNGLHHTYTNITGHDGDIDKATLLRFSPHDPWRPFNRFQHLYTPILYSLISFPWIFFGDYQWMVQTRKKENISKKDLALFLIFKASNLFLMALLPFLVLSAPISQIVVGLIVMHMSGGFLIAVVFQLAHLVEGVEFPLPSKEGEIDEEWAIHEMKTTSNFATDNFLLSWFLGGLNFQVEHHLFPQVCHIHYPQISKIVRQVAAERGVPYNEHKTFIGALKSHFRLIKKFGKKPEKV